MDIPMIVGIVVAATGLLTSFRVLWEYERGVVFRLGKLTRAKGPGLIFLVPYGLERMKRMDLRIVALDIAPQDTITKDNVSVTVNAVVYFRVTNPAKAVVEIEDYYFATSQLAQTTLRSVIGQSELDELLAERERINEIVRDIIDERVRGLKRSASAEVAWGNFLDGLGGRGGGGAWGSVRRFFGGRR